MNVTFTAGPAHSGCLPEEGRSAIQAAAAKNAIAESAARDESTRDDCEVAYLGWTAGTNRSRIGHVPRRGALATDERKDSTSSLQEDARRVLLRCDGDRLRGGEVETESRKSYVGYRFKREWTRATRGVELESCGYARRPDSRRGGADGQRVHERGRRS